MSLLLRLQRVTRLAHITNTNTQQYIKRSFTSPKRTKVKKKKGKSSDATSDTIQSTESPPSTTTIATESTATSSSSVAASQQAEDGGSSQDSSRRDWYRMKWYKFKRFALILGTPLAISTAGFALHESDIPYVYCLKKLANYPLPEDYDESLYQIGTDNPPPNPAPTWAQTIPMVWAAQFNSHKRLYK